MKVMQQHLRSIDGIRALSKTGVYFLLTKVQIIYANEHINFLNKMLSTSRKRNLIETAYIQILLHKNGYKLFVDEFHISMISVPLYNWSKRGERASISINSDPFTMSFVVGYYLFCKKGFWNEMSQLQQQKFDGSLVIFKIDLSERWLIIKDVLYFW